jgi:hypothetical protein
MMQILRAIVVTVIAGWFSWFLGKTVIEGIRTGAIRHTNSTQICRRKDNPIGFWSLVILFSGFVAMFILVWSWAVVGVAKEMK